MPSPEHASRQLAKSESGSTTRSALLWLAGGLVVVVAFRATGLDDRWLHLVAAATLTAVLISMRYQIARGTFVEVPPDLNGKGAAEFRLGVADGADSMMRFMALHVGWYWTKAFGIPIEWSAPGVAVASLAAAAWCHLRIVNGIDDVPPPFAKNPAVYARIIEKPLRLERKFYLGSFALFGVIGVMTWFLD